MSSRVAWGVPAVATSFGITKLGDELGFEMVDDGALSFARLLEPVALLWIHLAYRCGLGRDFAFKLFRHYGTMLRA